MSEANLSFHDETDDITRAQLVMVRRFVGQKCVLSPQLIIPMRLIWAGYRKWAKDIGLVPNAGALRAVLEASPWCRVEERAARGRIRTVVHGLGLKA